MEFKRGHDMKSQPDKVLWWEYALAFLQASIMGIIIALLQA